MAVSDYVNLVVYEDWADSLLLDELIASPAEDFCNSMEGSEAPDYELHLVTPYFSPNDPLKNCVF